MLGGVEAEQVGGEWIWLGRRNPPSSHMMLYLCRLLSGRGRGRQRLQGPLWSPPPLPWCASPVEQAAERARAREAVAAGAARAAEAARLVAEDEAAVLRLERAAGQAAVERAAADASVARAEVGARRGGAVV